MSGKYISMLLILFFNFLAMIILLSRIKIDFMFESYLVVLFLIIAVIMLIGIYKEKNWGYKLSALFFIAYLINIFYMYFNATYGLLVFGGAAILASIGFILSIFFIGKESEEETEKEYHKDVEKEKEEKVKKIKPKLVPYGVKKTFKPGKYVASKKGAKYHVAKCDWAKKINKNNRVWFDTEQEAKKKGYKACNCVKKS